MTGLHKPLGIEIIADVAVTKRHQRLDEISIDFTRTSFKSCFQFRSVMQYTPSTLNAIQFAQHAQLLIAGRESQIGHINMGEL